MVVGLQPDADLLSRHASPTSLLHRARLGPGSIRTARDIRARMPPLFTCLKVTGPPRSGVSHRTVPRAPREIAIEIGTGCARLGAVVPHQAEPGSKPGPQISARSKSPTPARTRSGWKNATRRRHFADLRDGRRDPVNFTRSKVRGMSVHSDSSPPTGSGSGSVTARAAAGCSRRRRWPGCRISPRCCRTSSGWNPVSRRSPVNWFFVHNHLRTVHAITSCNAAEVAMGC